MVTNFSADTEFYIDITKPTRWDRVKKALKTFIEKVKGLFKRNSDNQPNPAGAPDPNNPKDSENTRGPEMRHSL
jgi:hypothetical protein